jgi:hypothetical protein
MRLGEFAAAQRELSGEKDDFVFCGETFVIERPMPPMLMIHLGAAVAGGSVDEMEGMAALYEALRTSLTKPAWKRPPQGEEKPGPDGLVEVPADDAPFRRLYKLAVDNGVELEPLIRMVMALFEAQSGRPTQPVSASSPGRTPTLPSSSVSVTPAAPSHLRSVDDLIRGDSRTIEVVADPGMVRMGDGELVQLIPTERTG